MATIDQEIKLMSEKTFEAFVHQVLKVRYPGSDIKKVDGTGGDEGIDCFEGTLEGTVSIWQCKRFSDRIRKDQKRNILESIETAFRHRTPLSWTLCVPIDLRTAEHAWFQSAVVDKFGGPCTIKLLQNSDFLLDVVRNAELTKLFFQDTAIANLFRIEEKTLDPLSAQDPQEAINRYISDLCALDRRLGVVYSLTSVGNPLPKAPPDALFSIHRGYSVIHVVPRDADALSRHPIVLQFTTEPSIAIQINEAIDYGEAFSIPPGALKTVHISSPLLQSFLPKQVDNLRLEMTPFLVGESRKLLARLATSETVGKPEIPFIEMVETKSGRKVRTLEGEIPGLHIQLRIFDSQDVLQPTFTTNLGGLPIEAVTAILNFLYSLKETKLFLIYDPDRRTIRYRQNFAPPVDFERDLNLTPSVKVLLENVQVVSKYFGRSMRVPEMVGGWEEQSYQFLADIVTTGATSEITLERNVLVLSSDIPILRRILKSNKFSCTLTQRKSAKLPLFGLEVPGRPVVFVTSSAKCVNLKEVLTCLDNATGKWGNRIKLRISCGACEVRFDKMVLVPKVTLADAMSSLSLMG